MKKGLPAALAVLVASALARVLVSSFSLYLEPWAVLRELHLWQLVTWIPAGASLTFIAHAALLGFAQAQGANARVWLAATFLAGVLSTLVAFPVPAVLNCTFVGAGVAACSALWSWSGTLRGGRRAAASLLAFVPPAADAIVDGLYVLLPYAFGCALTLLWVRWSSRSHPRA